MAQFLSALMTDATMVGLMVHCLVVSRATRKAVEMACWMVLDWATVSVLALVAVLEDSAGKKTNKTRSNIL